MWTKRVDAIRQLEAGAIAAGTPEFTLMQRAGIGAARWIAKRFCHASRFVVICGGGNNGGDALVVAAELAARFPVCVYSTKKLSEFTKCAALAAERFPQNIPFFSCKKAEQIEIYPGDVVIDGLLGIGISGGVRPEALAVIRKINQSGVPVVALDLPSGVNGDTGAAVPEGAVHAAVTLTFGYPKPGLFRGEGANLRGALRVISIGLPPVGVAPEDIEVMTNADALRLWRTPALDCHKNQRGRVLVWGSSPEYRGAAALTAVGAMRAGAGMVRVASEAILQLPNGAIVKQLDAGATPAEWFMCSDVLVCGCGWGSCATAANLRAALEFPGRVVLDADALNLIAVQPEIWQKRENVLLTPHPGEAVRLAAAWHIAPDGDRSALAQKLAEKSGAIVLLKGRDSLVASPDGKVVTVAAGSPALAVAGSGDVLAGIIAAVATDRNISLAESAALGAYIHGVAGENAAGTLIADDLPGIAGKVIRAVAEKDIF